MGIMFGDDAEVTVEGDMVGRDKTVIGGDAYNQAAAAIRDLVGMPLPYKTEAIQAISTIKAEVARDEPSVTILEMAASSIAQAAPQVLQALVAAVPAIMQAAPAIADLLQ